MAHLSLRGGLPLRVVLRASVVEPDARLSIDALQFGSVRAGCCRVRTRLSVPSLRASWTDADNLHRRRMPLCSREPMVRVLRAQVMTFTITNPQPVSADWALGLPREQETSPVFVIAPCAGKLAPRQSAFVQVRFGHCQQTV